MSESQSTQPTVRLDVTLITADECAGTYSVALFGDQRQETQIQWSPAQPDQQTESVEFTLCGTRFVPCQDSLDGDTWRSLEANGLTDALIERILQGEAPQEAANALTQGAQNPDLLRISIAGLPGVFATLHSQDHGFDDYEVGGHPQLHRVTVGHGIKKGDLFNAYCSGGRKFGGKWQGSLQASLVELSQQIQAEAQS